MKINLVWPFAIVVTVLFVISLSPTTTARTLARIQIAFQERFAGLHFAKDPKIKVVTRTVTRNALGSINIKGSAKNLGSTPYKFLAVQYGIYDRKGKKVGTTRDFILNFAPGSIRYFEMDSRDARGVKARLEGTAGW